MTSGTSSLILSQTVKISKLKIVILVKIVVLLYNHQLQLFLQIPATPATKLRTRLKIRTKHKVRAILPKVRKVGFGLSRIRLLLLTQGMR